VLGPRIADFSTHYPGPLATHLLSEMGADVVKFENHRSGDGNRELVPQVHGEGIFHVMLNAGARSFAVDLRSPEWPEVVAAAAKWAEVVVVGGVAPALERRGLDFATMAAANPQIVYCMLPGYGNVGEWAPFGAHGQNIDALAGTLRIDWDSDGMPQTAAGWRPVGTSAVGMFAALGIMAGLYRRAATGVAQCVEVSAWGAAVWWNWRDTLLAANGEQFTGFEGRRSRYTLYRTSDDRAILLCPAERKFWEEFCDILELPPEMRARGKWGGAISMDTGRGPEYWDEIPVIQSRIGARTLDEWTELLGPTGIPIAPVLTADEAANTEHAAQERVFREVAGRVERDQTFKVPRSPVRFLRGGELGEFDDIELGPAPLLGEHNDVVAEEIRLGRSQEEDE
jgi:crotonobetainyl-CoA:carnitine CoA-transferase CaiB-like acyl-CoA transferase